MENKKSLQVLRHFFGLQNDTRPETFVEANYLGTRYDTGAGANSPHTLQILLNKNYTGVVTVGQENYLHQDMVDLIINTAQFHRKIDEAGVANRVNAADNAVVNSIITNVYAVWDQLNDSVRKFYMAHLYLLEQNTPNVWIIPSDIKASVNGVNRKNLRLNLTKVNPKDTASDVLFATTLPKLPQLVNGFKYTKDDNNVQIVQFADPKPDFLKDLYMSVYKTGKLPAPIPANTDAPAYKQVFTTPFSLDTDNFIRNTLEAGAAAPLAVGVATAAAAVPDNFDDLYESLTTGVKYTKDDKGNLQKINADNSKTPFNINEVLEINKGCGTLTKSPCDVSVYRCLLSGEPKNLSACLDKLKDANMFTVAKKEIQEMSPSVALRLLKTFGFKISYDPKLGKNAPPSFEHWVAHILPKSVDVDTLNAIRGNVQLMNYLNGVVNLIRSNTDLIDQKAVTPAGKTYATKAEVKYFIAPPSSGRSTVGPVVLQQGILTPRSSGLDLSLIQRIPNLFGAFNGARLGNMMGGAHKDLCFNARALAQMFDTTYSEMERHGKVLVDADKQRITDAVKRVNHLEEQLMRINEDIKQFNKLHSIITAGQGLDEVNLKDIVNSRTQITSDAISNLVSAATQNVNEQSRLGTDLVFKVQQALLRALTGDSSLLSRVN
jgi:hypothetical protein